MNLDNSNRPLSPHLTIYKPQITSVLSITHRMTGAFLYFGIFVLSWAMILGIYGNSCIFDYLNTMVGKLFLFAWTSSLFYHLLNGIRHLFWDIGKGLDLKTASTTGILVLIGAVILTALTWIIATNGVII